MDRPRSGRRAFATIFSDFGEKVAQLAGSIFSKLIFRNYLFIFEFLEFVKKRPASWVEKISVFENSNLEFLEF